MVKLFSGMVIFSILFTTQAIAASKLVTVSDIDQMNNAYLIKKMENQIEAEKLKNIEVKNKIDVALNANGNDEAKKTNVSNSNQTSNESVKENKTLIAPLKLIQVMGVANSLNAIVSYQGNLLNVSKGDFVSTNMQVVGISANNIEVKNIDTKDQQRYFLNNPKPVKKATQNKYSSNQIGSS